MTDDLPPTPTVPAPVQPPSADVAIPSTLDHPQTPLQQWAADLRTAYGAAQSLVRTSFVPEAYARKPEEAAAAIMTGQEVGLSPLAALRSIDIIQGTPAMRAVAQRALLQQRGHRLWVVESTATRAIVRGRRGDAGEDEPDHESIWTIERAQKLGLTNKHNWKNQPIAMLVARATSECARLVAADVLLGLAYSSEEVGDDVPASVSDAPAKPRASRTAKRAALEPADAPLPAEESVVAPEDEDDVEGREQAERVAAEARRAFELETPEEGS